MGTDGSLLSAASAGLALTVAFGVATWVASLLRHDASLVDRVWSALVTGPALLYFHRLAPQEPRAAWMLALAVVWAVRLSVYVTARNWGHGEDRRYQAIRARNQPGFGMKSLYLIFGVQALLGWMVGAPFLVGMAGQRPFGPLDVLGLALAAFGIVFEAVGDWQMARFKADPANRGQVMDRGVWRTTRHPNYFGETCIWWGFWLVALGAAGWSAAWTVVSPVVMTVLLLKVSGVSLLEKDIGERRPGYRDYIERTNAFFPGPRRRGRPR